MIKFTKPDALGVMRPKLSRTAANLVAAAMAAPLASSPPADYGRAPTAAEKKALDRAIGGSKKGLIPSGASGPGSGIPAKGTKGPNRKTRRAKKGKG